MKKILLQLVLIAGIVVLGWYLYSIFNTPLEFEKQREGREEVVIERLKDIRTAQRLYRQKYMKFTPSFDSLIYFVNHDSLAFERAIGSEDDSLAVAMGQVRRERFMIAVKDTIEYINPDTKAENLRYIPFSVEATGSAQQFAMDTASIHTESGVVVPVFEAFAAYPTFLGDLDHQELINFRDYRVNTLGRDDGLKVGSLQSTTNEAGNWE